MLISAVVFYSNVANHSLCMSLQQLLLAFKTRCACPPNCSARLVQRQRVTLSRLVTERTMLAPALDLHQLASAQFHLPQWLQQGRN